MLMVQVQHAAVVVVLSGHSCFLPSHSNAADVPSRQLAVIERSSSPNSRAHVAGALIGYQVKPHL